MGTYLAVNGSVFILLALIALVLLVSLTSRCGGYLIHSVRHFFILPTRRRLDLRLDLSTEEPHHYGYLSRRVQRWNGWT